MPVDEEENENNDESPPVNQRVNNGPFISDDEGPEDGNADDDADDNAAQDDDMEVPSEDEEEARSDLTQLIRQWENEHQANGYDPEPIIKKMAELIEREVEAYQKMDPDPFDERPPSKIRNGLNSAYKILFRRDSLIHKLVNDYLRETYWSNQNMGSRNDQRTYNLNVAACRLLLGILPGLQYDFVFKFDTISPVPTFIKWAEKADEPLRSYATGLLGASMHMSDVAGTYREENSRLVPVMIRRLRSLQDEYFNSLKPKEDSNGPRPFADLGVPESPDKLLVDKIALEPVKQNGSISLLSPPHISEAPSPSETPPSTPVKPHELESGIYPLPDTPSSKANCLRVTPAKVLGTRLSSEGLFGLGRSVPSTSHSVNECSNSSWAEMETFVIGSFQMHPPNLVTKQILILRYLTPVGEYMEYVGHAYEQNALEIVMKYIDLKEHQNARLAFEALKYLGSLLCHKKFATEFTNTQKLHFMQSLMDIRRPSLAACGVALCLYHLAYCEEIMERVCQLPFTMIQKIIKYALWLLECSHNSSRCHAVMFFYLAFPFQIILEEFDAQDGLRRVFNVVSTMELLNSDDMGIAMDDEEHHSARQTIRHVFGCLKRYFETHLVLRARQVKRINASGQTFRANTSPFKLIKPTVSEIQEYVKVLMQAMHIHAKWTPVDKFLDLGGVALLLKVIAYTYEWNFSGRGETVRNALDVLAVCTVISRVQLQLCEKVELPRDSISSMGMKLILGAAEGEIVNDADVQRAALYVICNCVCAPMHRLGPYNKFTGGGTRRGQLMEASEDVLSKMWESVRTNNGIMVLLQLLSGKGRLTDADSLRMLAGQALAGLARSETIKQIISNLPLLTNGQLQILMKDPILQDRRQEHVLFQKYALQLLERVSGKPSSTELSVANIHKASVVAQTRIEYNREELNQLMYQDLMKQGLTKTANMLRIEAKLPDPNLATPSTSRVVPASILTPSAALRQTSGTQAWSRVVGSSPVTSRNTTQSQIDVKEGEQITPFKLSQHSTRKEMITFEHVTERDLYEQSLEPPCLTLDGIIKEFLKNQHALCKDPVATCPRFDLFKPHKCPDHRGMAKLDNNFAVRFTKKSTWPQFGGSDSARLNRKLIHSKFCQTKFFKPGNDESFYTCVAFSHCNSMLYIGTYEGDVRPVNLVLGAEEEMLVQCHDSYISRIELSPCDKLMLTSCTWHRPLSCMFQYQINSWNKVLSFNEDSHVEFSRTAPYNRIIGTKMECARIYDVGTGKKILTLKPNMSNNYTKNRATFSPTDELVLSDGVLWDVGSGKSIHKFDKLNQTSSGVFHPNGLEILSNTEVWDLRTFHLLRTLPALDKCDLHFNKTADVIYSVSVEFQKEAEVIYESSYQTTDATNYASIATIDVKRNIYDLALADNGYQLALVENQGQFESVNESSVRIYDIGRHRQDDDEEAVDDEEPMDEDDNQSSSSSLSSDSSDLSSDDINDGGDNDDNDNQENNAIAAARDIAAGLAQIIRQQNRRNRQQDQESNDSNSFDDSNDEDSSGSWSDSGSEASWVTTSSVSQNSGRSNRRH
ncbi:protein mahjong [Neocloeon triangulifer]|uniref:protein mahjong n=1 Tax=Neocloeon triangulifer TaxID=2078957 RepID=UPI00286ED876|nr:protein mahjong [Neocloeon triangulifer]